MKSSLFQKCLKSTLLAIALLGAGCKKSAEAPTASTPAPTPTPSGIVAPSGPTDARIVPVSGGDAVIEPFFEHLLNPFQKWKVQGGKASARDMLSRLSWTASAAGDGPVLKRDYTGGGVELGPYSELVLSAGFAKGTKLSLRAETDAGLAAKDFVCDVSHTDQFVLPLPGAKRVLRVEITLGAVAPGAIEGNLLWLGLRDPQARAAEAARWKMFTEQPLDAYLRSAPEPSDASPIYNILAPAAAFQEARRKASAAGGKIKKWESTLTLEPHLGGANQNLFGRRTTSRDRVLQTFSYKDADGKDRFIGLKQAAQQAALAGDKEALREVARAAVQIAMIPHWDVDFVTEFPGGSNEQRCFSQNQACQALVVASDLAGSWLTDAGRALIIRRLGEDGLGNINYSILKWPYMFSCNQVPVFSVGRLAVYSFLEKQREAMKGVSLAKRVQPYTDLAFAELNESLAQNFRPDGGFREGSGYLAYTLDNAMPALSIYGNARGKPLQELLPPLLVGTDNYLEALRSTVYLPGMILVSDAQGGPFAGVSPSVLSVMAKIRPGGAAARMLAAMKPEDRGQLELWALPLPDLNGVDPNYFEPFVRMPETGFASSARKVGDLWSKLFVLGGPARAGHNHEDRGSFALEFGGETFAADPGGIVYADPMAQTMKFAQHHNMLVPVAKQGERPAAKNPAPVAVIPEAKGDAVSFNASINAGLLWPDYYKSWNRRFDSAAPDELIITDDYELLKGDGVEFLWHTPLPVKNENGQIIITGKRGRIIITPPAGTAVEITPSRKLGTQQLATLRFRSEANAGQLVTKVRLEPEK